MGCVASGSGGGGSPGGGGGVINYDPCTPNPCAFGTCSSLGGIFQCTCQAGYVGQRCNIPLDPCASSPCRNGATCAVVGPDRQFRCICPAGFTGDQCQNELQGTPIDFKICKSVSGGLVRQVWSVWTRKDPSLKMKKIFKFHRDKSRRLFLFCSVRRRTRCTQWNFDVSNQRRRPLPSSGATGIFNLIKF